ncbi:MAG: AmmeMemoRadiSam system protein B, partial [Kiritimatiellae bacterium]|nr:AmmeMemoRadiSam system protein B [Kiritimatiellia bacterium]
MPLESTIAGSWYPGKEREIRALADEWEKRVGGEKATGDANVPAKPNVLLLPHAGWAYSGEIAWRAVRLVRDADFRRVVVLAPSHRAWIENRLVAPESEAVSSPLGTIPIDREWLDRLALLAPVARNDRVHVAEHSAQIEYPLLQLVLKAGFTVVPLV